MFSMFRKADAAAEQACSEDATPHEPSASGSLVANESLSAADSPTQPHEALSSPVSDFRHMSTERLLDAVDEMSKLAESSNSDSLSSPVELSQSMDDGGLADWPLSNEELKTLSSTVESVDRSGFALLPEQASGRKRRIRGKRLERPADAKEKRTFTPSQRLLLLDSWRRSGLPAGDFAALVGVAKHTLYKWNQQFEQLGPEGLMDRQRGAPRGGRLPDLTKRTILMLKASHPEWGCQRISDMLTRGPALPACASSVARVLHEAGYELVDEPTRAHPDKVRRFERASPNQLWQTDLFTFMLKRQNRRVYLVAFMDDHSRFIVSYGLHASASTALVIESLEAGVNSFGPPEEILTDNGPQYVTWRGKSQFTRRLEQHGIRQIVARPRRPQTLGKIERFWGTLWREFLETAVFIDLADARTRIGLFIDYYNFQRVHRGVGGLVPADRFFGAATEVARTLKERVAANSLELARHGEPRAPFYVTGQVDGNSFSVHAEGSRFILTRPGHSREEVELTAPPHTAQPPADGQPEPEYPLPNPVCPTGEVNGSLSETLEEVDESNGPSSDENEIGGEA